ncbi:hypothetical protein [Actinoplanes flavus]|uniref:Uncharacterized protein n=1 Tax=Actinoplanes flavus TaxID=2820290 RepID=A0ABS3UD01_9ACTN|nr:hypothetical protein [Actinoplanes flavus]MBO3736656.1 hypothetical protein [Actinoplanes flavus]
MIEHDKACTVCTYALNPIDDNGTITYEHPVAPAGGGHNPAPVPAHQLADVYRRCHLCSDNEPVWMYRTPQIEVMSQGTRQITETYSTQWNICIPCAALIEQDDHVTLTQRSIAVMRWHPADPRAQLLGLLHRAIVLTREPGRTLLTTGAQTAAPLKASTLPKVRDRLAGLLRGTIGLPAPIDHPEPRRLIADSLDQARLYWIDPQFTTLVAEVLTDLPDTNITDRIVPAGSGLLAWSTPLDHRHRIAAASWAPQPDGWQMICYRSLGLDQPPAATEAIRHEIGWLVPIHVEHVPHEFTVNGDHPLAALIASWLIIAQQLTHDEPTPVDSPIRKAYARARRPAPEVRLLRIRPRSSPPQLADTPTAGARTGRAKPDHRFWVSGHKRNQAYGPGRTLRQEIDIDPFLKGPENLPIKASTTVRVLGTTRQPPEGESSAPGNG